MNFMSEYDVRYGFFVKESGVSQDPLSISFAVLQQFNVHPEMYHVGFTKLFFRTGQVSPVLFSFFFLFKSFCYKLWSHCFLFWLLSYCFGVKVYSFVHAVLRWEFIIIRFTVSILWVVFWKCKRDQIPDVQVLVANCRLG